MARRRASVRRQRHMGGISICPDAGPSLPGLLEWGDRETGRDM